MSDNPSQDLRDFLGKDRFGCVMADPPWRFTNRTGKVAPEHKRLARYPTMTVDDICALPVADHLEDRAHCYMWVPNALLPEGLQVLKAWGFEYKSNIIWHKIRKDGGSDGRGVGFYFRNVTEILLFGTRGKNARTLAPGRRQVNMMQTRKREEFKGFNRKKAIHQSYLCMAAWIALAVVSGPLAIFTVLIPMMIINFIGQSYILTNHMLRPQMDNNHPVDNSMSVRAWRWIDPLHFHFSHHVEHHLFPKMGSDQAPKVRAWLQQEMPERYVCPSHVKAVAMLYKTPRVYQDANTLVDPLNRERTVDVMELQGQLN